MTNEAAKEITRALLGVDFKTVFLGGKAYTIHVPTAKIITRSLHEWADIDFNIENQTKASVVGQIPTNINPILRGLSFLIVGDVRWYRWKAWLLYRKLRWGTPTPTNNEIYKALIVAVSLMGADDFFDCAALLVNVVSKMAAHPKS